jgi:hypothetical protein
MTLRFDRLLYDAFSHTISVRSWHRRKFAAQSFAFLIRRLPSSGWPTIFRELFALGTPVNLHGSIQTPISIDFPARAQGRRADARDVRGRLGISGIRGSAECEAALPFLHVGYTSRASEAANSSRRSPRNCREPPACTIFFRPSRGQARYS